MDTVLIVDHERIAASEIGRCLVDQGYRVEIADGAPEALGRVRASQPSLVILDLAPPGLGGPEIRQQVGQWTETPLIVLGTRCDEDRVAALEAGADDCLPKPFNPQELAARVRAVLRRCRPPARPGTTLAVDHLELDVAHRRASVAGRPLHLRPKEFDLLRALAEHPGVVLDRRELVEHVWGGEAPAGLRIVDVYVVSLRDRLDGTDATIQTVWGVGYRLVPSEGSSCGSRPPQGARDRRCA